jgi:hypothetical protein
MLVPVLVLVLVLVVLEELEVLVVMVVVLVQVIRMLLPPSPSRCPFSLFKLMSWQAKCGRGDNVVEKIDEPVASVIGARRL